VAFDRTQVLTAPKDGPCGFPWSTDGSQHHVPQADPDRGHSLPGVR